MTDIALDEKLAPCPFCGGTVKLGNENIFVCTGCGANISLYSEDIVSEWNRRASPSQVAPQPQAGEPGAWLMRSNCGGNTWAQLTPDIAEADRNYVEITPLYAFPQPANPAQVTDAMVEAVLSWVCDDVLPAYDIPSEAPRSDPELPDSCRAALTAAIGANTSSEEALDALASIYPGDPDGSIRSAIGVGGQAVASLDDVAARMWKADAEDSGTPASVAAGRTREAFDNQAEELKARWRKGAKAAAAALSQPHPADKRVVEALAPGTIRICPPRDRPCPHGLVCPYVDGYNCTDPALSAKDGRS